ncbi:MAG: hypothetical protein P8R42_05625 [Candidatus Binatia bacterium]|nr:hypothetical protein [Candidatus Binatia bacterium]
MPLGGILVLGVQRSNGQYFGAPSENTSVLPGDVFILYGRAARLSKIDVRRADDAGLCVRLEGAREQRESLAEGTRLDALTPA